MLEEVAMQLLRPNFPVISVKKLKNAVRQAILERPESFIQAATDQSLGKSEISNIDNEDLKELVLSLVSKL